jgi:DNA-binding transcriptional regulator YhcF (GntR family)
MSENSLPQSHVQIQPLPDAHMPPGPAATVQADTRWVHLFRAMIDSGDLARMDGSTFKVYAVIKAYTNIQTGAAVPGVETIAEKCGLARMQVWRALQDLQEMGSITKTKRGRHNVYQLREKVPITDGEGRTVAHATWDYLPTLVKEAIADLRQVLLSGDLAGAKVVHIDHLHVQVNVNEVQPGGIANSVQVTMAGRAPGGQRSRLTRADSENDGESDGRGRHT